ncbi:MAG: SPOR domain-containing protein [Treponema sp.]|nr:SPOR domain-containing protein [Treponema sp.]
MKKQLFVVSVLIALVVLQGASVWEGAAAVSSDFPESGLYIATNSFPRNTVIDLTNLETGKTVRVIVTAGLDTPGLLAVVSKEAADAIGLRSRAIGRIRLVEPQDPIAFSRQSDDFRSGDPDYDPFAAVTEKYGEEAVSPERSAPANGTEIVSKPTEPDKPVRTEPESYWNDSVTVVPVPGEPGDKPAISEEPFNIMEEEPTVAEATSDKIEEEPIIAVVPPVEIEEEPAIAEIPPVIIEEPVIVETPPEEDFPETSDAIAMASNTRDPMVTDLPEVSVPAPVVIAEPEPAYTPPPSEPAYTTEPVYTPPPVSSDPGTSSEYAYTLIPADERPPDSIPSEPPHSIPAAEETPHVSYVPPDNTTPQIFSVPAVSELESGKYYLQLGAYSHTPTVEQELAKIERGYPVTVQCIMASGKNAYRVLIGPVNQGEAGALLKKFQAKGYKDAFVRRG